MLGTDHRTEYEENDKLQESAVADRNNCLVIGKSLEIEIYFVSITHP